MRSVFALIPGVVANTITDLVWATLTYLYFALGTKLAYQVRRLRHRRLGCGTAR
ncbi:hypothetical protein H7J06_29460 [Mycobacterium hodleri]|uniref:hypothetical protein n=1 Tax=Mycolicibacterium hodleri TaxID=49897 RepID=UPI0021F2BA45|nr:hypothetical protein [Mycolicibacterium hodleri]MCV7137097.1 hypothetical protein [Mycolicibacterium hodleri]